MRYQELTFWQNLSSQQALKNYQRQVGRYFELVDYDIDRNIIDTAESKRIRQFLNREAEKILTIFRDVTFSVNVVHTPPPAIGGLVQRINLIDNLFNLQHYDIEPQALIDMIDQVLGVYERDFVMSIVRTFNPLYWLGKFLEIIASLPFYILGRLGFERNKLERSSTGKVVKWLIKLLILVGSVWEVLARLKIIPQEFDLLILLSKISKP